MKSLYSNKFLKQEIEIESEELKQCILTEEEKEYLRVAIKPYKNRVEEISKITSEDTVKILIRVFDFEYNNMFEVCHLEKLYFQKGTLYKRMEEFKAYSLKELGLL